MKFNKKLSLVFFATCFAVQIAAANQAAATPTSNLYNFNPWSPHVVIQAGGFNAKQGHAQNIGIDESIGNRFTVNDDHDTNFLAGLGVYVDAFCNCPSMTMLGINAFYLAKTNVKGDIIQEQVFTNLDYRYSVTNYPVYLAAKTFFNTNTDLQITLDLGVGPNFIKTSDVHERSLDGGITVPDNAFSGETKTVLSATVGVGVKYKMVEVGYRFFYLGEGKFHKETDELLNTLNTGNSYANALVVSVNI